MNRKPTERLAQVDHSAGEAIKNQVRLKAALADIKNVANHPQLRPAPPDEVLFFSYQTRYRPGSRTFP